ncbi:MAG: 50S ribosomal protein L31 [Pseudothermotoga sp.]
MKDKIHPEMKFVSVKCACGAEHKFYTTRQNVRIDVCSNCHPLYKGLSGASLVIDAEGRIEKFNRKYKNKQY